MSFALDPNHFTVTRISAPYFVVDANVPTTITKAYVGFEVKNNSNSATTYTGLRFAITSITSSVAGQNYTILSPASGQVNIGTLAPGESRVCYFYVSYPALTTPTGTFNVQLSNNTAGTKIQSFAIYNRSSISANAGGTATQSFTNQDLIGGIITDDVTYVVGNVQNSDENDLQVSVASQFDPTKMTLLGTQVTASAIPGIPVGTTDSLYFISGNGANGATVTVRWTFRISGYNFTNYLLPCAGATSGSTNYKYALNTSLGSGTPVTVSSAANPLTITKTSDKSMYRTNTAAVFTVTINNPGAYGVTIDKITDQLPAGFTFGAIDAASQVTAANSTSVPVNGATGTINFEGGVVSGANTSYYIPASGSIVLKYSAVAPAATALNLQTTVRDYIAATEVGSAQNTVGVSATLPVSLLSFKGTAVNGKTLLEWTTANETNSSVFEIERSGNSNVFENIGAVNAGARSYSFIDSFPSRGTTYYRLKMTDRDGQFTYSSVIAVSGKATGISVSNVGQNPFSSHITLKVMTSNSLSIQISISDAWGRNILHKTTACKSGENLIQINDLQKLSAGTYFLQVISDEGSWQQQVVKH
jgi:uncharacterized repeat protein (TIGR01451 family)